MSRIRKAAIMAGFTYAQFAVGILSGIILVPLTLHYVGARSWGLWLATGELLSYAGMTDLGIIGVMPWMVAEADGRQDRAAMRKFVGHGVWIGGCLGLVYAAVATILWIALPSVLRLSEADRLLVGAPFAALIVSQVLNHPFRVFRATLWGIQDAWFNGVLSIVHSVLTMIISIALMMNGYGLFALALGAGLPPFIVFAMALARLRVVAPDLMSGWTRPTFADARLLLTNGAGVWLAAMGWQLLSASNAIVITYLGHPEWVPIYSCTAKLSVMTTQLTWVPPDSALVGLAQLYGEPHSTERLRKVVLMMLRLHLLLGGAALCGLLAFNPSFVARWVGAGFFGGLTLNALLAAGVVIYSLVHGVTTTASVVGNRLRVGVLSLVNGVVQTALALVFGRWWGLEGIAVAGLTAGLATSIPAGILLLRPATQLTAAGFVRELFAPWFVRAAVLAIAAGIAGAFYQTLGLILSGVVAAVISLLYVWQMRTLYVGLPLDARWTEWLVRLRLMPEPERADVTVSSRQLTVDG
jgi:O-antigen/teichoic acid export membrane protein